MLQQRGAPDQAQAVLQIKVADFLTPEEIARGDENSAHVGFFLLHRTVNRATNGDSKKGAFPMTKRQLIRHRDRLLKEATERASWVYLNPQNAATWRADAAKFRALAAAAEVDIQIGKYEAATR